MRRLLCLALALLAGLAAADDPAPAPSLAPPVARPEPRLTILHGETLVDEYAWLRGKGTPEVEAHLRAELDYARAFMRPTEPLQARIYEELLSRIQQTDTGVPYREGGHFYYPRTEAGKQYPIHCRRKGKLEAPEEIVLDLNDLARGKPFLAVGERAVSPDGKLLAFTTDETGFRQFTLRVRDLSTRRVGPEAIERVTSVAWAADSRTLLYTVEHPVSKRSYQAWRHVLGQPGDVLVLEEKDERFSVRVGRTSDRRYLLVQSGSLTTSEVAFLPASRPAGRPRVIAPRRQDHEYDVDHRDGLFYIRTNDAGRNFRLVTAPVSDPAPSRWKELVPHRDDVMLEDVQVFRGFVLSFEREGGLPHLKVAPFGGGAPYRISFPEPAYAVLPRDNREYDARTVRFSYQSPVTSESIYDFDVASRERTLRKQVAVPGGFDPTRYRVDRLEARGADGTAVPIWTLRRADAPPDGRNPALLYGYGAYGAAMNASFSSNVFSLVDRGVVFAVAYVRGGGELGKAWHDAGRMANKPNTFSDFIAAAEHLVAAGVAAPDRLAIQGGSAGGLLVGAVLNQRPGLFRAALAQVPFVDVVNTMLDDTLPLTVGEFEEWGNPKVEADYRVMRSYSPYENVGARGYPALLVKSSYNDSQVMYWEPAKWVARLRARKTDANPLLLHVNMDPAGHGGKSGRYDRLREVAFDYAFLLWQLGVEKVEG